MLVLTLLACQNPTACTALAAASVGVSVADPDGNPVPDATVTWSNDANPAMPCDVLAGGWICAWEVSGALHVDATYDATSDTAGCAYHDETAADVTVPMDAEGCHVVEQHLSLVLDPTKLVCSS